MLNIGLLAKSGLQREKTTALYLSKQHGREMFKVFELH